MTTTLMRQRLSEARSARQVTVTGQRELETIDEVVYSRGDLAFTDLHTGGASSFCCCFPDFFEGLSDKCQSMYEWVRYSKREREDLLRARVVKADCLEQVMFNHGTVQEVVARYNWEVTARAEEHCLAVAEQRERESMGSEDSSVELVQTGECPLPREDFDDVAAVEARMRQWTGFVARAEREASDDEMEAIEDVYVHGRERILEEAGVTAEEYETRLVERDAYLNRRWAEVEMVEGLIELVEVTTQPVYKQVRQEVAPRDSPRVLYVHKHIYSSKLVSSLVNETRGKYGPLTRTDPNWRIVSHYMRRSLVKHGLPLVAIDRHVGFAAEFYFENLHYDLLRGSLMNQSLGALPRAGG